jgi:hypothetical protein
VIDNCLKWLNEPGGYFDLKDFVSDDLEYGAVWDIDLIHSTAKRSGKNSIIHWDTKSLNMQQIIISGKEIYILKIIIG